MTMPDFHPNTNASGLIGRIVGYTDTSPEVADGCTRWGRVTGGIYAGSEQWLSIAPLHDHTATPLIRAKRVHTTMPKNY